MKKRKIKAKFQLKFYKNQYRFNWTPYFIKRKLRWKDKFETPRCETEPYFRFEWLWFGIHGMWGDDQYWEQWLWIYEYNQGDIKKAKESWPWTSMETKESTWVDY